MHRKIIMAPSGTDVQTINKALDRHVSSMNGRSAICEASAM
jgi:hypothetical protein